MRDQSSPCTCRLLKWRCNDVRKRCEKRNLSHRTLNKYTFTQAFTVRRPIGTVTAEMPFVAASFGSVFHVRTAGWGSIPGKTLLPKQKLRGEWLSKEAEQPDDQLEEVQLASMHLPPSLSIRHSLHTGASTTVSSLVIGRLIIRPSFYS